MTLKPIESYTERDPSPIIMRSVALEIIHQPTSKYTEFVTWKQQGIKSVTWSDFNEVFEIPARKTHLESQRQGTKSVTWYEHVEVIYIPKRETFLERQGTRKGTTCTWDTYVNNFFLQEKFLDLQKYECQKYSHSDSVGFLR